MRRLVCAFWIAIAVLLVPSCGGGGGGGGTGGGSGGTGSGLGAVNVFAAFEPATRSVPGYADALRVTVVPPGSVKLPGDVPQTFDLTRSQSSKLLSDLAPSDEAYHFQIFALTDGAIVGRVSRTIVVKAGEKEQIDVSAFLVSEVHDVAIEGPSRVSLFDDGSVQYTAYARDVDGRTLFTGAGFDWTSSNGRALHVDEDSGLAIPLFPGDSTVKAKLKGTTLTDSLDVAVVTDITVYVSPSIATLQVGQQMAFTATVTGVSDHGVTWRVDEPAGGTITQDGQYFSPAVPGTYHVRATSTVDTVSSGVATVKVANLDGWRAYVLQPAEASSSVAYAFWNGKAIGNVYLILQGHKAAVWPGTTTQWDDYSTLLGDGTFNGADGDNLIGTFGRNAKLFNSRTGTRINLKPAWAVESAGMDVFGNEQVGFVTCAPARAILWHGTAASAVDLSPLGADTSKAYAIFGNQQVGSATFGGASHAGLWTGTPDSWVDLTPAGTTGGSEALGVYNGVQVGYATFGGQSQAGMWTGTAASWVSLNPSTAVSSRANGIYEADEVGSAQFIGQSYGHAVFWHGTPNSAIDLHLFLPPGLVSSVAHAVWHDGSMTYVVGEASIYPRTRVRHSGLSFG